MIRNVRNRKRGTTTAHADAGTPTGQVSGRELTGRRTIELQQWHEPYRELSWIFAAPDPEELDRRAVGFMRAFRAFRSSLKAQHCDPDRNGGFSFRDPDLAVALEDLWRKAAGAKCGDLLGDREAFERRTEMTRKINELIMENKHVPR